MHEGEFHAFLPTTDEEIKSDYHMVSKKKTMKFTQKLRTVLLQEREDGATPSVTKALVLHSSSATH